MIPFVIVMACLVLLVTEAHDDPLRRLALVGVIGFAIFAVTVLE